MLNTNSAESLQLITQKSRYILCSRVGKSGDQGRKQGQNSTSFTALTHCKHNQNTQVSVLCFKLIFWSVLVTENSSLCMFRVCGLFFFWNKVSCSPGWLRIWFTAYASLELLISLPLPPGCWVHMNVHHAKLTNFNCHIWKKCGWELKPLPTQKLRLKKNVWLSSVRLPSSLLGWKSVKFHILVMP